MKKGMSRRRFLQTGTKAALGLTIYPGLACNENKNKEPIPEPPPAPNEPDDIPDIAGVTIHGKVLNNKLPLAGVVVSDGYNVTKTDKNGIYYLRTDFTKADFVFVTIPSGYEVRHKNSLPFFYQRVSDEGNTLRRDFELKKVDNDNYVLIILADTHICGVKRKKAEAIDSVLFKNGFLTDLKNLQSTYPADTKFYGLHLGDIVWERYWDLNNVWYPDYLELIKDVGFPIFHTIGNHDYDVHFENDDLASEQEYRKYLGPTYYSFNLGKVHYVVLDDMVYINTGGDISFNARISDNQIDWLKKDLINMPASTTSVVVAMHCPSNRRNPLSIQKVENREELYALLSPYDAHIVVGHNHQTENIQITNKLKEHIFPSICGAGWYVPFCTDGSPTGYGVCDVKGSDILFTKKSIGFERDYQFRVYKDDVYDEEGTPTLMINLFDWDEDWTVECYEGEKLIKKGGRFIPTAGNANNLRDPLFSHYFENNYLVNQPYCRPAATDHLFYFTPENPEAELKLIIKNQKSGYHKEESIKLNIG